MAKTAIKDRTLEPHGFDRDRIGSQSNRAGAAVDFIEVEGGFRSSNTVPGETRMLW